MSRAAYKLGCLSDGVWQEHVHLRLFRNSTSSEKNPRIEATLPDGDPSIFSKLAECMSEPYFLLYLLHTPRGEGNPGRYQSPPLAGEEVKDFLDRLGTYLSSDSRFDLWIHSPSDQATLVWDRHDIIYAYGLLDQFLERLKSLGFCEGLPEIPSPHEHHYRKDFDADASSLLKHWEWSHSELHAEDEQ